MKLSRLMCVRSLLLAGLATALLNLLSGCGPHSEASTASAGKTAAPTATVVMPARQDLPVTIEQPGQIEAFEQTPIHAKIAGYVAEVCVDMNARVEKGDCLARLAVPEMEDDLHHKK